MLRYGLKSCRMVPVVSDIAGEGHLSVWSNPGLRGWDAEPILNWEPPSLFISKYKLSSMVSLDTEIQLHLGTHF